MARTSFADYQATRYFFPLDGLRALSAALVVTWHTRDSPLEFLQGERGVTVFFVLSGYLITMLALREEESKGSLSISGFFLRRVFRILPLYYIVLAAYAVLVYLFEADKASDFTASLPYHLLYLSEVPLLMNEIEAPFNHAWSLGIEEKFYMVWPFLAFGLMKSSRLRLPMSLLLGAGLLIAGAIRPEFGQPVALLEPYGHILIGAAMAFALHTRAWYDRLGFLQNSMVYWLLGVACVVLGVTEARWAFELLAVPTALFVGAMVLQPRHAISRLLGFGPLAWLGTLSYAVYLIHPAVLRLAERLVPSDGGRIDDLLTLVIGYGLSVVISVGLHRLIEKPFIKWGRKFDKSRRPPSSVADTPVDTPSPEMAAMAASTTEAANGAGPVADDVIDLRDSGPVENRSADSGPAEDGTLRGPSNTDVADDQRGVADSGVVNRPVVDDVVSEASDVSFGAMPPAVAWGTGAWVEARGTVTARRSSTSTASTSTASPNTASPNTPSPNTVALQSRPAVVSVPVAKIPIESSGRAANADHPTQVVASKQDDPTLSELIPSDPASTTDSHGPASVTAPKTPADQPQQSGGGRKWLMIGLLAVATLLCLVVVGYLFGPGSATDLPAATRVDDVRVEEHALVDGAGSPLRLQGVTQSGAEYACAQGWGIFDGPANEASASAMSEWSINAVRLPLNENCWLGTQGFATEFSGQNYQSGILDYVDILRAQGHAVVLSLSWSGMGDDAGAQGRLPTRDYSVRFWESVASQVGDRPGVVFELFASPDTSEGACLLGGCTVDGENYVGFQTLIEAIRSTGSVQPLILTAPAPGVDTSFAEEVSIADPLDQLIIGFKAVDVAEDLDAGCSGVDCWEAAAEAAAVDNDDAARPSLAISFGTADCSAADYGKTLDRLETAGISVFVPGWNTWDACGETPGLLANDSFAPTPVGEAVQNSFG